MATKIQPLIKHATFGVDYIVYYSNPLDVIVDYNAAVVPSVDKVLVNLT